jgi:hypothetical protein
MDARLLSSTFTEQKEVVRRALVNYKYCKGEINPYDVYCHGKEYHAFIARSSYFAIATAGLPLLSNNFCQGRRCISNL